MSQRQNPPRNAKTSTPVDSPKTPSSVEIRDLIRSNREVLQSIRSLKEEIESFRKSVSSLEGKVASFEASLSTLREGQKKCESNVRTIQSAVENLKTSQSRLLTDIFDEMELRQQRVNNIMVFGLPEKASGSLIDKEKFDKTSIEGLLAEAGVGRISPGNLRRVGKIVDGRSRPLKVELAGMADVQAVLRSGKTLRKSTRFKTVFVSKDFTKMQQIEMQHLRTELKKRKESGEDVVIYGNQIRTRDSLQNFRN